VLFLLNDPGDGALQNSGGTGMLSMTNSDPTTTRQLRAIQASGFDRRIALHWNGIPWPAPKQERNGQVPRAAEALDELLAAYASLALGKAGLRAAVTLLHKELKDDGVHATSVTVHGPIAPDTPLAPELIAERYWTLHNQPSDEWTDETHFKE
jgi:hypothetical protein